MYIVHHLKNGYSSVLATSVPVRKAMLEAMIDTTVTETATVRAGRVLGVVLEADGVCRPEVY
jgi:hypothetical protein